MSPRGPTLDSVPEKTVCTIRPEGLQGWSECDEVFNMAGLCVPSSQFFRSDRISGINIQNGAVSLSKMIGVLSRLKVTALFFSSHASWRKTCCSGLKYGRNINMPTGFPYTNHPCSQATCLFKELPSIPSFTSCIQNILWARVRSKGSSGRGPSYLGLCCSRQQATWTQRASPQLSLTLSLSVAYKLTLLVQ